MQVNSETDTMFVTYRCHKSETTYLSVEYNKGNLINEGYPDTRTCDSKGKKSVKQQPFVC